MKKYRGSQIAQSIDIEYKKKKEWEETNKRLQELNKDKNKKGQKIG